MAWHGFLLRGLPIFALAVLSLTVSLATRTFHTSIHHSTSVHTNAPTAMRQHLDKDAAPVPVPVYRAAMLDAPEFYPRFAAAGPPVAGLQLDQHLYNRPPPSC
jgi:hypothetical protein